MFYNPPFPFSFGGVDLSTAAGEKWVFRTLPPPLRGRVNERVAKEKSGGEGGGLEEEEGGILCPNTGPTQHMFIIGIPGQALFSLPDSNLKKN